MICPNCQSTIPDDSIFCQNCGIKISEYGLSEDMIRCPSCHMPTPKGSNFCTNCRAPLSESAISHTAQMASLKLQQEQLKMQAESLKIQQQQLATQALQYQSMVKCPRCGSTSISGQKKGYGVVKGGLGAVALGSLTGPVGAVIGLGVGNAGKNKVKCTCMNCGYKFKAGKGK